MAWTVVDLQAAIPDAYNDTVLRDRISRLGAENDALEARLAQVEGDVDGLEGDEDEEEEGLGMMSTLPLVLSVLALVGVVVILGWWASRGRPGKVEDEGGKRRGGRRRVEEEEEDDEDEDEASEDYDGYDDEEEVPRAKARKKVDDDDLDEVIKKLKK